MEPATLLTLPPEIQTQIFGYLTASFGKTSIQAVLRTCRQLYNVALPVSVSVFRNAAPYPKEEGPCSRTRNVQFLRYVFISKPWLAKYVKTAIFGWFSTLDVQNRHGHYWDHDQCPISYQEIIPMRKHIEHVLGQLPSTRTWAAEWVHDLQVGSSDAQVAFILLVCPNIETLLFEMPRGSYHFHQLLNFTRFMSNPPYYFRPGWKNSYPEMIIPLSNVQDVSHETVDSGGYQTFYKEAPILFGFPKLRFYECFGAQATDQAAELFAKLPPRSSSVEKIVLHASWSTADLLQDMLGACKALKKFEYSHQYFNAAESEYIMMPRDILEAILPHANTLEVLYLNSDETFDKEWDWEDCPERLYFGTELRQMCALRKLTIGMQELTGMLATEPSNNDEMDVEMPLVVEGAPTIVECLPENLEQLMIHSCGGLLIVDQLIELIHAITYGDRFNRLYYLGIMFLDWAIDMESLTEYFDRFKKELADIEEHLFLEIGYQTKDTHYHDLYGDIDEEPGYLMSRIHAPHLRTIYRRQRMTSTFGDGGHTYGRVPHPFED